MGNLQIKQLLLLLITVYRNLTEKLVSKGNSTNKHF